VRLEADLWGGEEQRRPGGEMDQVLNKVGSYWFSKRASKEIDSIGDDLNVRPLQSFSNRWPTLRFY
jgi:hypothetical protein